MEVEEVAIGEPNHEIANFGFAVTKDAPVAGAAGASCFGALVCDILLVQVLRRARCPPRRVPSIREVAR